MQVAILSAEHDNGWTFVPPEHSTSNLHSTPLHRNSKASQGSIYADASSSTYGLFPTTRIPLISEDPREGHAESPCILEEDGQAHDRDISVLPLQTSILAHVPADTDFTTISMLQLHMLHVHHTPDLVLVSPEEDILKDITRNFYELSILTRARWRLKAKPVLPFQLSALEVMHTALDREDANLD